MIGIIGAMDIEVDLLKAQMQEPQTKTVSGISFVQGLLCGRPAVVARCGVGKVNAAVCAQTMILNYAPESVINTGVAGSLSNTFDIGDVVVADYVVQGDVDTTALGDPPGFISTVDIIKIPCSPSVRGGLLEAGTALGPALCERNCGDDGQLYCHERKKGLSCRAIRRVRVRNGGRQHRTGVLSKRRGFCHCARNIR